MANATFEHEIRMSKPPESVANVIHLYASIILITTFAIFVLMDVTNL